MYVVCFISTILVTSTCTMLHLVSIQVNMMGHTWQLSATKLYGKRQYKYTDNFPLRNCMARDILWSGHGNRKTMGGCLCAVLSKLSAQGCLRRLIRFEPLLAA